ncbi:hypothetical protein [Botrimarina sp.]|uniref:hypothetical protein n=1 Tax=Botrimarina sp. TaxID=2795802 RepID=UPI0032ED6577
MLVPATLQSRTAWALATVYAALAVVGGAMHTHGPSAAGGVAGGVAQGPCGGHSHCCGDALCADSPANARDVLQTTPSEGFHAARPASGKAACLACRLLGQLKLSRLVQPAVVWAPSESAAATPLPAVVYQAAEAGPLSARGPPTTGRVPS